MEQKDIIAAIQSRTGKAKTLGNKAEAVEVLLRRLGYVDEAIKVTATPPVSLSVSWSGTAINLSEYMTKEERIRVANIGREALNRVLGEQVDELNRYARVNFGEA